jgi:hypothetical protein
MIYQYLEAIRKKEELLNKIEKNGGEQSLGDCLMIDQYNKEIKAYEKIKALKED